MRDLLVPTGRYTHTVIRRGPNTYETTSWVADGNATRCLWKLVDFLMGRLR